MALEITRKTLFNQWQKSKPLPLDDLHLQCAIQLFSRIALDQVAADERGAIKAFVEKHARRFRSICKTGLPFALFAETTAQSALTFALKSKLKVVGLFAHILLEDLSAERFDEKYGQAADCLPQNEIAATIYQLMQDFGTNNSVHTGYCLLWLVKRTTRCAFEMPRMSEIDRNCVVDIFSEMVQEKWSIENPISWIEILFFECFPAPLFHLLISAHSIEHFAKYAALKLCEKTIEEWPSKIRVMIDLLKILTPEGKRACASAFAQSKDQVTAQTAGLISSILNARSFTEAIPQLYELQTIYPSFNEDNARALFGYPFMELCKPHEDILSARSIKNLHFPHIHEGVVYGVRYCVDEFEGKRIPHHLMAFESESGKMRWAVPLEESADKEFVVYQLKMTDAGLAFYFDGGDKIHFLKPETGEKLAAIQLPAVFLKKDALHLGPQGQAYLVKKAEEQIYGGRLEKGLWIPSFQRKIPEPIVTRELYSPQHQPEVIFKPLSTHISFSLGEGQDLLIGPQGHEATLKGCNLRKAFGDKLFVLEANPHDRESTVLTIRTLKDGPQVVSEIEKSILLKRNTFSFGPLCQNNLLVLFAHHACLFVDLNTDTVSCVQIDDFDRYKDLMVNQTNGEIWTRNVRSQHLHKITRDGISKQKKPPGNILFPLGNQ